VLRSPKGYEGQVEKSELDRIQDSILLSDASVEQPGLVVTLIEDTPQERDRFVAQFGGVAATATYGIFSLGDTGGFVPSTIDTVPPPVTGVLPDAGPPPSNLENPTAPGVSGPDRSKTGAGNGIGRVAQAIADGFRYLFQNPRYIPAIMAVWLLFAAPGYLLARRRSLLVATGGTA
jgi:hypothetical protein